MDPFSTIQPLPAEQQENPSETFNFSQDSFSSSSDHFTQNQLDPQHFHMAENTGIEYPNFQNHQVTVMPQQSQSPADSHESISDSIDSEQEIKNQKVSKILCRTVIQQVLKMIKREPKSPMKKGFLNYYKKNENRLNQKQMKELLWGNAWKNDDSRQKFRKFFIEQYLGGQYLEFNKLKIKEYLFFLPQLMKAATNEFAKGFYCKVRHPTNKQYSKQNTKTSHDSESVSSVGDDITAPNTHYTRNLDSQSNESQCNSSILEEAFKNEYECIQENHAKTSPNRASNFNVENVKHPFLTLQSHFGQRQNLSPQPTNCCLQDADYREESAIVEYSDVFDLQSLFYLEDRDEVGKCALFNNYQDESKLLQEGQRTQSQSQDQPTLNLSEQQEYWNQGQSENEIVSNKPHQNQQSEDCQQQCAQEQFKCLDPNKDSGLNQEQPNSHSQEADIYSGLDNDSEGEFGNNQYVWRRKQIQDDSKSKQNEIPYNNGVISYPEYIKFVKEYDELDQYLNFSYQNNSKFK